MSVTQNGTERDGPNGRSSSAPVHELKVIIQEESDLEWAEECAAKVGTECYLFLQPEWSVAEKIMPTLVEYAKRNPKWSISIQSHKYMRIP